MPAAPHHPLKAEYAIADAALSQPDTPIQAAGREKPRNEEELPEFFSPDRSLTRRGRFRLENEASGILPDPGSTTEGI